jgi:hypothetical protein
MTGFCAPAMGAGRNAARRAPRRHAAPGKAPLERGPLISLGALAGSRAIWQQGFSAPADF